MLAAASAAAAAAAASTMTALAFLRLVTFRTGMIILEVGTVSIYAVSAPARSLAEPPPAASPQPERLICQHGRRSARIRGLLLVLAAASAAAASATTALAFLRLVTFLTGMIKLLPGIQCVRVRRAWVLILPFVVFVLHPAMQQEFVVWLILDLDG